MNLQFPPRALDLEICINMPSLKEVWASGLNSHTEMLFFYQLCFQA